MQLELEPTFKKESDFRDAQSLLHCGICREAKEVFFDFSFGGLDRRPRPCACQRKQIAEIENRRKMLAHENTVDLLIRACFPNSGLRHATFENAGKQSKALLACARYASNWNALKEKKLRSAPLGQCWHRQNLRRSRHRRCTD